MGCAAENPHRPTPRPRANPAEPCECAATLPDSLAPPQKVESACWVARSQQWLSRQRRDQATACRSRYRSSRRSRDSCTQPVHRRWSMSCYEDAAEPGRHSDSPTRSNPPQEWLRESRRHSPHPARAAVEDQSPSLSTCRRFPDTTQTTCKPPESAPQRTASSERTCQLHRQEPRPRRKVNFPRSFPSDTSTQAARPTPRPDGPHQQDRSAKPTTLSWSKDRRHRAASAAPDS